MREQAAPGGETAVGGDEMAPAGLLVHGPLGGEFGRKRQAGRRVEGKGFDRLSPNGV
jgi:hypothetical protein